jgi:hypothetical protein
VNRIRVLSSGVLGRFMASFPPPDTVHQILDDLDGDRLSLRACALVHSSWALASQARLFHTVAIDQREKWRALVHLLKTSPHIRPLLRRLDLVIPRQWWDGHFLQDDDFVEPLLALFPRVDHVTQRHGPLMDALFCRLPSLVSLELHEVMTLEKDATLSHPCSSHELAGALALRSLVVTDVTQIAGWLLMPEWIQMRVHGQSLRRLEISLPWAEDGPAHRRMYEALTVLEELTLDVSAWGSRLNDFGWCSLESRLQTSLTHCITALALGRIPVSRLHLHMFTGLGYENLSFLLGPLRETSFPELRQLCILLKVPTYTYGHETRGELSIDIMAASAKELRHWTLRPSVADRLESVVIEMKNITDFHHTTAFLELFGHANRPGVLRVSSGGARLLD